MARTATRSKQCTHHWLIDGPEGPESRGRCTECGAERTFQNSPARPSFDRSLGTMGRYRSAVRSSVREEIRLSDE